LDFVLTGSEAADEAGAAKAEVCWCCCAQDRARRARPAEAAADR